ncbi:hypothetical protein CHS0354_026469 [Potamilus streckersoni]|uniref:Uncharacterized protein n=1 Tax=Potamilus streckersoni TaxID=2493646 RepID=A0AAE0VGL5_9BIVA|nr:hypothetical protein CHS0354_026469 [Potamilus streckersoni]
MGPKKHKNKGNISEVSSARPSQKLDRSAFDPTKNTHMWTMWRIAVNEKLLKESKSRDGDSQHFPSPALTQPPLAKYIQINDPVQGSANLKMSDDYDRLPFNQFIYYGIPRITMKNEKAKQDSEIRIRHIPELETSRE